MTFIKYLNVTTKTQVSDGFRCINIYNLSWNAKPIWRLLQLTRSTFNGEELHRSPRYRMSKRNLTNLPTVASCGRSVGVDRLPPTANCYPHQNYRRTDRFRYNWGARGPRLACTAARSTRPSGGERAERAFDSGARARAHEAKRAGQRAAFREPGLTAS